MKPAVNYYENWKWNVWHMIAGSEDLHINRRRNEAFNGEIFHRATCLTTVQSYFYWEHCPNLLQWLRHEMIGTVLFLARAFRILCLHARMFSPAYQHQLNSCYDFWSLMLMGPSGRLPQCNHMGPSWRVRCRCRWSSTVWVFLYA